MPPTTLFVKRLVLTVLSLTLWSITSPAFGQTQPANEIRELPPGQTLERELTGAETHRYKFDLKAEEFFQVRVEQKGVDVLLKLLDARGNALATMDSPNSKEGPETLSFIAIRPDSFILEVSALDGKAGAGNYSIRRAASRLATAQDKRRVEVEHIFVEGLTARNTEGQEEVALNKLAEAVKGWEEVQDKYLTELTALNLFLLSNQLPQDLLAEAQKLLGEGKSESLTAARDKSFKALELFRRFYRQLDEKPFIDVLARGTSAQKTDFKLITKFGELNALTTIGIIFTKTGNGEEGVKYYKLALAVIKEMRSSAEVSSSKGFVEVEPIINLQEASNVSAVGSTLSTGLNKPKEALEYLNQALILFRVIQKENEKDRDFARLRELLTLRDIGNSHKKLDHLPEALKFFEEALAITRTMREGKSYEAQLLLQIATIHFSNFNNEQSLAALNQALKLADAMGDKALQADILSYIKVLYFDLGDEKSFREYANQELAFLLSPAYLQSMINRLQSQNNLALLPSASAPLNRSGSIGQFYEKTFDSLRLLRIGNDYKLLEEYEKALEYYEKALAVAREIKEAEVESIIATQVADLYVKQKQWEKAIEYAKSSLAFERQRSTRSDLALSLRDVGYTYLEAGRPQEALPYFNESLAIWYALGAGESKTVYRLYDTVLTHIARTYDALGNRRLAIVFGKLAVNAIQRARGQLQGFDRNLQDSYLKKNEKPYSRLADWLISEGRLLEAEQVLAMLKEEEVADYLRRDKNEVGKLQLRVDLRPEERDALRRYNEIADNVAALGAEFGKLQELKRGGVKLSAEQERRYDDLAAQIEDANRSFQVFLRQLAEEFARPGNRAEDLHEKLALQSDLKEFGAGVVYLYTLVGDDRYRVILATPDAQVAGSYEITAVRLNKKIEDFRQAVINPSVDPRPLGKELYDILIGPVEKQLAGAQAKTLLWSLDGNLRLLPLAALWDGKQYFGQKYQNVTITLASLPRLGQPVSPNWRALGLGVSEAKTATVKELNGETQEVSFPPLPAVRRELRSIVRSAQSPGGVLPGQSFLDAAFNEPALETQLARGYKVIHIASHFQLNRGDSTRSFLLLGDGSVLTVDEMRNNPRVDLRGVELLALSACATAVAEKDSSGKEVEGFGYVAQQKGAKAILATLWSVADESTQLLMSEFYRLRKERPGLTKAAALQLAQQEMIAGTLRPSLAVAKLRGLGGAGPSFAYDPKRPYAHPYYWSPFILIGNWR
ncbi:MAG TPA: CHAT domain-containing tetratricopeptide repeat protein [Pyrinomonadaceae bacterium]|jgi:CHAT domain-containing protein